MSHEKENPCKACGGSGISKETCHVCNGDAVKKEPVVTYLSSLKGDKLPDPNFCPNCKGKGREPCARCGGTGKEPEPESDSE